MAGVPRWMRARAGVRVASALSAAAVVAVALIVAGAALVLLVGQSLRGTVEEAATQRAVQLADRVAANFGGDEKKNAIDAIGAVTASGDLAQVVVDYSPASESRNGIEVLDSTEALRGLSPISWLAPRDGETVVVPSATVVRADGSSELAVVVARGATTVGRPIVVLTALPLDGVSTATDAVLFYLLFGVPLLIVVTGFTTYLFAGRALRPVEAIRTQVAAMTEKDLARRVPVPAARDEVGRLAETMNGMIARLQDAQGVQRRFVADASHELRSPLATIAAGLELLVRDTSDPATVTALRGETERLGRLVDALLLLARADERGLQPRRDEVDLDEVAEAELGRPTPTGVRAEVRAEPVRVIGDRGQLARVLRNLVDNALRHARSRVLVTVGRDRGCAVVEVRDDGPGVAAADRARVFERFVRLDAARARADGGSGLGLAIVAEVVAAHGGTVEVAEAPGGGALFRVRLRAATEPGPARARPPGAAPPAQRSRRDGRPRRSSSDPLPVISNTGAGGSDDQQVTDQRGVPIAAPADQRGSTIR